MIYLNYGLLTFHFDKGFKRISAILETRTCLEIFTEKSRKCCQKIGSCLLACSQNCHLNTNSKYCAGLLLWATQQSHCIRGLLVEKLPLPGPIKPSTLSTLTPTVNFECQSTPTYFHLFQRLFIRAEGNF